MPFTFAHPALVIPVQEKCPAWFDATALILGSMAPDFEYFLRFKAQATTGHTLTGFLLFNLPLVLMITLLWHTMIKKPFILSLPNPIGKWFSSLLYTSWTIQSLRNILGFAISAIVGMTSHVLWDAFTHADAFFVKRIPFLTQQIDIFDVNIGFYKILQHGSTLIGFTVIFAYLIGKSQTYKESLPKIAKGKCIGYWAYVFLVTLCTVLLRITFTMKELHLSDYGVYIVTMISSAMIGIISVSILYTIFRVYNQDSNECNTAM